MLTPENSQLSPRESILMENEKEENRLAREHAVTISKLNIELKTKEKELEVALQSEKAKWAQLFRIPIIIIMLPVYTVLAFGYIASVIKGQEPSSEFWKLLK